MNVRRDLIQILIFQILSVPAVILLFKFIEDKKIASIFASIIFLSFCGFGLWKISRWPNFKKELLFWLFVANLTLLTLPIFLTRLLNWNQDFSTLTIFGIPAQAFHQSSERFGLLMLVVIMWKLVVKKRV